MGSIGFQTFDLPRNASSLEDLALHFAVSEPFHTWDCAFCERASHACGCVNAETSPGDTPRTKAEFQALLLTEQREASKLQSAAISYLDALEKHVPLGCDFNVDQQRKIARAHEQLDRLRERFSDLHQATHLFACTNTIVKQAPSGSGEGHPCQQPEEHPVVPDGLVLACDRARALLANCFGNIRECHVCFKLNYMLCKGQ